MRTNETYRDHPQPSLPRAAQQVLWEAMSEEEWRQKVLQVASLGGWRLEYHTYRSKRSPAGFPDEVMIHEGRGLLLVAELKREKDFRVSEAQQAWLAPRSEERRVGKECGYQCRSRWSPYH